MAEVIKYLPTYKIKEGVFLVEGALRSAIYNTNDNCVYSINNSAEEIILSQPQENDFLNQLKQSGLIDTENLPVIAQLTPPPSDKLEFIWLNLTSRCNLRCLHCYNESSSNKNDQLNTADWMSAIEQSASIGCKKLQFIGGEPMLDYNIFQLINHARSLGFGFIEIFSNGTLITREDIKKFKELDVNIAISLYSDQANIHDQITGVQGSFDKTIKSLEYLRDIGVNTRIGFVLMKQNQETAESTLKLISSFGFNTGSRPDIVRPLGRGDSRLTPDKELVRKFGLTTSPNFITNPQDFNRNYFYNPCWYGKISVNSQGQISPCIMSENKTLGIFNNNSIIDTINSEPTQRLWSLNKDKIETCCVCEYRYACGDCRPLSETETNNPYGKTSRCTYDPFSGKWP